MGVRKRLFSTIEAVVENKSHTAQTKFMPVRFLFA